MIQIHFLAKLTKNPKNNELSSILTFVQTYTGSKIKKKLVQNGS